MNWLDRAIGTISPQRGLQRARARAAMNVMQAYEGARSTRRTEGWITSGNSPNADIGLALDNLRNRSRSLVQNNPYCARALDALVSQVIGTGILAESKTDNRKSDKKLEDLWSRWVDECDADGQLDFYGLQDLAARTVFESGEALVRVIVSTDRTLAVPMQLRILEPDHLDTAKTGMVEGNNIVVQGVEYDARGQRVAYWLFDDHPGDVSLALRGRSYQSRRVAASGVLHVYRKLRAGQGRGVPVFAPVIVKARDLDELLEAFLVRRKIEACLAAFRITPDGADGAPIGIESTTNSDNQIVETFEPGMITKLSPGEDVKFVDPSSSGGLVEYVRLELHALASGIGVTYQGMTGDLSDTSWSSHKAGAIYFNRLAESLQWSVFVRQMCRPIRRRFVEVASIFDPTLMNKYGVEWTPPRFESVDPMKDAEADLAEVRAGFATVPQCIKRRGYDPRKQLEQIKAWNDEIDSVDVVLDSDPRKRAKSGSDPGAAKPAADAQQQGGAAA